MGYTVRPKVPECSVSIRTIRRRNFSKANSPVAGHNRSPTSKVKLFQKAPGRNPVLTVKQLINQNACLTYDNRTYHFRQRIEYITEQHHRQSFFFVTRGPVYPLAARRSVIFGASIVV